MGVLIDSGVFITSSRRQLDVSQLFADRPDEHFAISVITVSEILHGVERATDPAIRSRREAFAEFVIGQFESLEIDLQTARLHAQLSANLAMRGQTIGPHDLWIAATCLQHDLSLVTANGREFRRVPGLRVEEWP